MLQQGSLLKGLFMVLACAVLAMNSVLDPILFFSSGLALVLFMVIITHRYTALHALGVLAAAAMLTGLASGIVGTVIFLLEFGFLGLLYALCLKNRVDYLRTLVAGLVTVLVLMGLNLTGGLPVLSGDRIEQEVAAMAGDHPEMVIEAIQSLLVFLPWIFVSWGLILAWSGFFLATAILYRIGSLPAPLPELDRWRLPWPLVWVPISGLVLILLADRTAWPTLALVGANVLFVAANVFLLGGLALTTYLWREIALPKWFRYAAVAGALLFWPAALVFLVMAGFLDMWVDCRVWYERRRDSE